MNYQLKLQFRYGSLLAAVLLFTRMANFKTEFKIKLLVKAKKKLKSTNLDNSKSSAKNSKLQSFLVSDDENLEITKNLS
jgi:hypothetical protein